MLWEWSKAVWGMDLDGLGMDLNEKASEEYKTQNKKQLVILKLFPWLLIIKKIL